MRNKLLFIMPSLAAGGGERSLVNLLSQIDYEHYQVDLFLFQQEGLFMDSLPSEVRLLPLPEPYRLFALPLIRSIWRLAWAGMWGVLICRVMFALLHAMKRATNEQVSWKYVSRAMGRLPHTYDAAIGFMEKTSLYFCVDQVSAARKIGWIHTDYDALGVDPDFDRIYFEQCDDIIAVSEQCADILKRRFPEQRHKVHVIHNIVSPDTIIWLSDQHEPGADEQPDFIHLVSIGRLNVHKGFEMAIASCKILVDKGYPIRWRVIGEGGERDRLAALIREHGLEATFLLLGLKPNPYPYLKQADIYVQPSRVEGKSIAIDEAKVMHKPIVVTNFNTAHDQIEDGVTGLIVDMHAQAIAAGIERLICDQALRERLIDRLSAEPWGTELEVNKLYRLVHGQLQAGV